MANYSETRLTHVFLNIFVEKYNFFSLQNTAGNTPLMVSADQKRTNSLRLVCAILLQSEERETVFVACKLTIMLSEITNIRFPSLNNIGWDRC